MGVDLGNLCGDTVLSHCKIFATKLSIAISFKTKHTLVKRCDCFLLLADIGDQVIRADAVLQESVQGVHKVGVSAATVLSVRFNGLRDVLDVCWLGGAITVVDSVSKNAEGQIVDCVKSFFEGTLGDAFRALGIGKRKGYKKIFGSLGICGVHLVFVNNLRGLIRIELEFVYYRGLRLNARNELLLIHNIKT